MAAPFPLAASRRAILSRAGSQRGGGVREWPTMTGRGALALACEAIYREALAACSAGRLVAAALRERPFAGPVRLLALGKAAAPMLSAALEVLGERSRDPLCLLPGGERP